MFVLQVLCQKQWRWGIKIYATQEAAEARVKVLGKAGIIARVQRATELYV